MSSEDDFDAVYFDITKFLAEYEQLPGLWDVRHKAFKNVQEKSQLLTFLGHRLGITDSITLRRKIRSVRGSYNTEIRKIKQSLESQNGVHVPKLSWFPLADKFLRVTTDLSFEEFPLMPYKEEYTPKIKILQKLPKIKGVQILTMPCKSNPKGPSRSTSQYSNEDKEYFEECEYLEFDNEMPDPANVITKTEQLSNSDEEHIELYQENQDSSDSISFVQQPRKRRKNDVEDTVSYLKKLASTSENEFLTFGQSIGLQLQSLPLKLALQLQMDIQAHVTKARLDYLKQSFNDSNNEC